jgi:hypothetical protein
MKNLEIENSQKTISINGDSYMHILSVCVIAGNDSYQATDSCKIEQVGDKLTITNNFDPAKTSCPNGSRLRYEPAVEINLISEGYERTHKIQISHHKGQIYLTCV